MLSMARAGLLCVATLAGSDAIAIRPPRNRKHEWGGLRNCLAMEEAGLDCMNVSVFGNRVNKFDESYMKCIWSVRQWTRSEKIHKYNFQGKLHSSKSKIYAYRRKWVVDFMREHFTDRDVFRDKPWPGVMRDPTPFGPYDKSFDPAWNNETESHTWGQCTGRQELYFRIMSQSMFTLCPGGDYKFSKRFWEAIAVGSVPVIHSEVEDIGGQGADEVGYKYFTTQEVLAMNMSNAEQQEELQEVATANWKKLIRYQTFLGGDNVPPGAVKRKRDKDLCSTLAFCRQRCKECM